MGEERHRLFLVELPLSGEAVGLDEAPSEAEDERHREVGSRLRDVMRDDCDRDLPPRGGLNVNDTGQRPSPSPRCPCRRGRFARHVVVDRRVAEGKQVVGSRNPVEEGLASDHRSESKISTVPISSTPNRLRHDRLDDEDVRLHGSTSCSAAAVMAGRLALVDSGGGATIPDAQCIMTAAAEPRRRVTDRRLPCRADQRPAEHRPAGGCHGGSRSFRSPPSASWPASSSKTLASAGRNSVSPSPSRRRCRPSRRSGWAPDRSASGRTALISVFVLSAAAMLGVALAPTYGLLLAAAAVAGVAMGSANPATNRLVVETVPRARWGTVTGSNRLARRFRS